MILTQEQRTILDCGFARKRVIAGAGSGKTAILVEQAARWAHDGDPDTMIAMTFTRRAAAHLRAKLAVRGVELAFIGTVHAWCYVQLWRWGHRYILVDEAEAEVVAEHVLSVARLASQTTPARLAKWIVGDRRRPELRPAEMQALRLVRDFMHSQGLLYVGDVPREWLRLAEREPRFVAECQARARCILWDEYQDTNEDDAEILRRLAPERLFLIGDPCQSIYGFRGASPRYLMERNNCATYPLTLNWRSGREIVNYCNRYRSVYAVTAAKPDASEVRLHLLSDGLLVDLDVGDAASLVRGMAGDTGTLHVLCRTNREIALLAGELADLRPWVVSSQTDRFNGALWRYVYWLCAFTLAPDREWLRTKAGSIVGDTEAFLARAFPTAFDVARWIGWLPTGDDEAILDCSVAEFVAWYMARDLQDQLPDGEQPRLVLMTAHASKGLEFPRVCVLATRMPLKGQDMEQERNIYYVACSRAESRLDAIGCEGGFAAQQAGGDYV